MNSTGFGEERYQNSQQNLENLENLENFDNVLSFSQKSHYYHNPVDLYSPKIVNNTFYMPVPRKKNLRDFLKKSLNQQIFDKSSENQSIDGLIRLRMNLENKRDQFYMEEKHKGKFSNSKKPKKPKQELIKLIEMSKVEEDFYEGDVDFIVVDQKSEEEITEEKYKSSRDLSIENFDENIEKNSENTILEKTGNLEIVGDQNFDPFDDNQFVDPTNVFDVFDEQTKNEEEKQNKKNFSSSINFGIKIFVNKIVR